MLKQKNIPFTLDYNEENLEMVSKVIIDNLTLDLIPRRWIKQNEKNPLFGHCHHATGCLQRIFTPEEIKTYRGLDNDNIFHWWGVDNTGKIIDITADQYYSLGKKPPYRNGERHSTLGWSYINKVETMMERIVPILQGKTIGSLEAFI